MHKRGLRGSGNSKGQVTIFMIIGILVLFAVAGILFITTRTSEEKLEAVREPVISKVPLEFQPLQAYTENCLQQIGKRGLLVLGQQGGYIYPELVGKFSSSNPTDADGVSLEPLKVPYWHYNQNPNTANSVVYTSLQPKLYASEDAEMSVEAQLGRFVAEKMGGCIDGYKPFTAQGFEVEVAAADTEVHVTNEAVAFLLTMPVTAARGEARAEMDQFYVKIPLRLKHYYEIANAVREAQVQHGFLEDQAMSLIDAFSSLDTTKLPPRESVTFDLVSTRFWLTDDIVANIKSVLNSYVPMLQFYKSHNFQHYNYPESNLKGLYQGQYNNLILPLEGAEDVEVRFNYFNWEPYVDVNDLEGVVKPEHIFMQRWFVAFGTQRYRTIYDLSYPVLVTVDDPLAFDNQGFQLNFALEGNIRNNDRAVDGVALSTALGVQKASLACRKVHWDAGPVKAIVVDSFTQEPLELVRIGITIPNQDDCELGMTDRKGQLESSVPPVYGGVLSFVKFDYLTNFYPIDTYELKNKSALVGYALGISPEPVIALHRLRPINLTVKKIPLGKCVTPLKCDYTLGTAGPVVIPFKDISCSLGEKRCFFEKGLFELPEQVWKYEANGSLSKYHEYYFTSSQGQVLESEEQAVVTLTRVADLQEGVYGAERVVVGVVQGSEKAEVELVPGKYKVETVITKDKPLLIPKDQRSLSFTLLTWENQIKFELAESKMDKIINGRVMWDTPETYLIITPEDLYNAKELEVYVPTQELDRVPASITVPQNQCGSIVCIPGIGCTVKACLKKEVQIPGRVIEEMQMMADMANISRNIRTPLEPQFK